MKTEFIFDIDTKQEIDKIFQETYKNRRFNKIHPKVLSNTMVDRTRTRKVRTRKVWMSDSSVTANSDYKHYPRRPKRRKNSLSSSKVIEGIASTNLLYDHKSNQMDGCDKSSFKSTNFHSNKKNLQPSLFE